MELYFACKSNREINLENYVFSQNNLNFYKPIGNMM